MAGHSSKATTNKSHQSVVAHGSDGASTSTTTHDSKTRLPGIAGKGNSLSEKYTNKLLNISTYLFSTVLWKTKPMNSQEGYDKPDVKQTKSERQQQQQQQQQNGGGDYSEYYVNYGSQRRRSKDNKIITGNSSNNHISDANIVKPTIITGKQQSKNSKSDESFEDSQSNTRFRVRSISDGPTVRRQLSERLVFSGTPDILQSIPGHSNGHSSDMVVSTRDNRVSRSASQSPQITASHHHHHPVTSPSSTVLCCDKCDGKHATDECPYYKKGILSYKLPTPSIIIIIYLHPFIHRSIHPQRESSIQMLRSGVPMRWAACPPSPGPCCVTAGSSDSPGTAVASSTPWPMGCPGDPLRDSYAQRSATSYRAIPTSRSGMHENYYCSSSAC